MPNILLHGGPLDGDTALVGEPWPRTMINLDNGTGSSVTYKVRASLTDADLYVPPAEDDPDQYDTGFLIPGPVGPQGPPGPIGDTGPQGDPTQWNVRGIYDPAVLYQINDVVSVPTVGTYIAIDSTLNEAPATHAAKWHQVLSAGPQGIQGIPGATGATGAKGDTGSPLPPRATKVLVTGALVHDASEVGTVLLALGYRILRIATDKPAWVRLYTTAAKRAADAARVRTVDVDPTTDHGLVVEVSTSDALLALDLSPVPQGYSMEAVPSANIPYRVKNLGADGPVTVTFTWQAQEA